MDWSDADADLDASEHATRPRMDMRLERHSVVRFQRYWAEDGDVDLQLIPATAAGPQLIVRVHSDAFKRDSKSGRRFIRRVLAQRDCTVVVNYTDVDAADVVHMLDALHHRETVIEDFETPQWLSVYKAAVHFRLHGLFRLAAAHLEERLPEMERFNLACAYMHRAWLVELLPQYMTPACTPSLDLRRMLPGFAAFIRTHRELRRTAPPGMSAQEREDVLRRHCPTYLGMLRDYPPRPAWAVPWELTPAEARVFKRFGKWQPDVPAERTGDGAAAVRRARKAEDSDETAVDEPIRKRPRTASS